MAVDARAASPIFPKTEPLHLLGRATHLSAVIVFLSIRQTASFITLRTIKRANGFYIIERPFQQ